MSLMNLIGTMRGGNVACFFERKHAIITRVLTFVVLAAGLAAVSYKIETLTYENYVRDLKLNATIEMAEVRERLEKTVVDRILALKEMATIIGVNPEMNQTQFNIKAVDLVLASDDVKMVAAAPDFEVTMVFPKTGNEDTFGKKYRDMPQHFLKIEAAMQTGDAMMTGPIELSNGGTGLILRMPTYSLSASGMKEPWGVLSVVLDYEKFLNNLGIPELEDRFDILIYDAGPITGDILLGDKSSIMADPILLNFNLPFGTWKIAATADGGWPKHLPNYVNRTFNYVLFIAGCLIAFCLIMRLSDKRQKAERMLSVGIEGLEHGFVMFDSEHRLVAFNRRYKEIAGGAGMVKVGSKYEDIVKANLKIGLIPEAIGREDEWYENWSKRLKAQVVDNEHVMPDGTTIRAYDRLMNCGSMVGLRIDISDLRNAQRDAETANRAKTEFMGVLSHELRTPLTIILGHARLAKNMVKLPKYRELLSEIENYPEAAAAIIPKLDQMGAQVTGMMYALEQSGEHLYSLISEILDFAKVESGTLKMVIEQTNVSSIVNTVAEQMRPMVEDKGLSLEVATLDCDLNVDASRIRQVLINLIGNAAKFTEQGTISVSVVSTKETVEFHVKDTGIGIQDDQIENVFEAFHQIDSTSTRKHNGTGLGLAISRDIARAHEGELTAKSVLGEGSTFVLTIPRFAAKQSDIEDCNSEEVPLIESELRNAAA